MKALQIEVFALVNEADEIIETFTSRIEAEAFDSVLDETTRIIKATGYHPSRSRISSMTLEDFARRRFPEIDATDFTRAILATWEEINASGQKAGADHWTAYSADRDELYSMVQSNWSRQTGQPEKVFPFNVDAVCSAWLHWRKTAHGEKSQVLAAMGGELISNIQSA